MRAIWLATAAAVWAVSSAAAAQTVREEEAGEVDAVVVTARAGAGDRTKAETSYAITTLPEERLRLQAPLSVADTLKAVPGFWVESSGGEAGNNIRARGIPRDGYSSVAVFEDGAPIQHDPGLGFLNADQSFRLDETIERIEVVRGGPSSIFASNAPGGVVNFITRKPGEAFEGLVKGQVGDYGLYRADAWIGGPIGGGWGAYAGGFHRQDDGVRDAGYTADQGGQIRVGVGRELARGRIDLNLKHLNDKVTFYLPIPLTFDGDGEPTGVPGFDPNFGTLVGPDTQSLTFRTPTGDQPFDLTEGTHIELTQFTADLDYELGGGVEVQNLFRVRVSDTLRNGLFPGSPQVAAARLATVRTGLLAAFPGATDVQFRYVQGGGAFDPAAANGNGLVIDGGASSVSVPLDEIVNDFRLARAFDLGGRTHDVALGLYAARFEVGFDRYTSTLVQEVRDNARRLDIVAVDAAGQVVGAATENGFTRYGSQYNNAEAESLTTAVFLSDEWQVTPALRIDAGVRWERVQFDGVVERSRAFDLGTPGTLADNQALGGTGVFDAFDFAFEDVGFSVGANYQFQENLGAFARYTDTFRLPNATDFIGNATRTDVRIEPITLAEAGLKLDARAFDLFATAFYTAFEGFRFTETRLNPITGALEQRIEFADTETYGVELEGLVAPVEWFDVRFNLGLQDAQFKDFVFTEIVGGAPVQRDFDGNQLLRVPQVQARFVPGLNLLAGRLRAELDVEYYSDRFADAANSVELPAFAVLGANARFDLTDALSLYLNGTNLTNEIGLTEGNPRAGQFVSGDAGARFFSARPILGRTVRAAVLYRF